MVLSKEQSKYQTIGIRIQQQQQLHKKPVKGQRSKKKSQIQPNA